MNEENKIKELLNNAQLPAGEYEFLERLGQRIDAVEPVKRYHESVIKRVRIASLVTFVIGLAVGTAVIAFILIKPLSIPKMRSDIFVKIMAALADYRIIIALLIAVTAVCSAILSFRNQRRCHL